MVEPAGLTAAYQLVKEDVDGDVYEAELIKPAVPLLTKISIFIN